jgi:hypothetical protein
MSGLRTQRNKVPEHVRVLQMRDRVTLLRMNEAGEQRRVPDEENRRVVAHQIPHTIIGVKLHGETAWITRRIGRSRLTTHRRKPNGDRSALADLFEHLGRTVFGDVVRHLEVAECTGTFGVDHTFGNALTVKMRHFILKMEVLQQGWTALADGLDGGLHAHRGS